MQNESHSPNRPGAVNHPGPQEWMAWLYDELPGAPRRELNAHLETCATCREQVAQWRRSLRLLDRWPLPVRAPAAVREWVPALRWAVAAVVLLAAGVGLGQITSSSTQAVKNLRAEVARLATERERQRVEDLKQLAAVATEAAGVEAARALVEFAASTAPQQQADKQALAAELKRVETRLNRLRAELETLAVNTQNVFEQTHDHLSQLATYALSASPGSDEPPGQN